MLGVGSTRKRLDLAVVIIKTGFLESAVGEINKTAFAIHTLEMVNHYQSIWKMFDESELCIITFDDVNEGQLRRKYSGNYSIFTYEEVLRDRIRFKALVSNHPAMFGNPANIKYLSACNIRFMYAAGKSAWNFQPWNQLYDLILCFGPYHARNFQRLTNARVVQMGYPRLDVFFRYSENFIRHTKSALGCCPTKKTVLWLPTWKELSSIEGHVEEVSSLLNEFNVVVKLHPLTPVEEPARQQFISQFGFTALIADESDNAPLYGIADYVLCDYGGPPFAAIYLDKNLLLLNVHGAESNQLTGRDSTDLMLRKYIKSVNPGTGLIHPTLKDSEYFSQQSATRVKIAAEFFAPYRGNASEVAFKVISEATGFPASDLIEKDGA